MSTGTAGTGHPAPSGVMSFAQVHPYLFLHFRVFLKTSPSTGWTSSDAAPLTSSCMKNPWVTGAVWGCDNLAGATGFVSLGAVGMGWVQGLRDQQRERCLLPAALWCYWRTLLAALSPLWMLLPWHPGHSTQCWTLFPCISQGRKSFSISCASAAHSRCGRCWGCR